MHNNILAGHLGEKKTKDKVLQRFYWCGIREDVKLWVQQCDTCAKIKGPVKHVRAPLGEMTTGAPWDRLSTDILGPFPESFKGNKYIMVVTDHFSKWVEIFAIPNQTAITCADILLNEVIDRYGCPYDIHSDQGRNYVSQIFMELCQLLEIRKTRTTPYHASGNGQAERFN
jgi:transposase InsO family protein